MRFTLQKEKHYKSDGSHTSSDNAVEQSKGSHRYHRLRRYKQLKARRTINIFFTLTLLVISLVPLFIYTARNVFAQPSVPMMHNTVAVTINPPTPTPSFSDPLAQEVKDFLRRVHRKESSSGTNTNPNALHTICRAKGQSNEYGYGGMQLMMCFPSHHDATVEVARWYREHRPVMESQAMTYCYYALGVKHKTCPYWEEVKHW